MAGSGLVVVGETPGELLQAAGTRATTTSTRARPHFTHAPATEQGRCAFRGGHRRAATAAEERGECTMTVRPARTAAVAHRLNL